MGVGVKSPPKKFLKKTLIIGNEMGVENKTQWS